MIDARDQITFSLASLTDFENRELVGCVLTRFLSFPADLKPAYYYVEAADRRPIDPHSLSELARIWLNEASNVRNEQTMRTRVGELSLERDKGTGYQINWRKENIPSFSFIGGYAVRDSLQTSATRLQSFLQIVSELTVDINAVYGEVRNMAFPGWDLPMDLERRLPDIPWLSIYGQPYVELFGEDRIETAPFHQVDRLPSGHYVLQASPSMFEPVPEDTKARIRAHLNEEAFMSGGKWRYQTGSAPKFDFRQVMLQ